MNFLTYSFSGAIVFEDYNFDVIEKRFEFLTATTLDGALDSMKAIATAYASGIGGARIISCKATQTYTDVQPPATGGEPCTLVALASCEIAGTSPQEYAIVEIPAPNPAILSGNDINLAHPDFIDYMNLIRLNCLFGVNNGTLETDTAGDTLVLEGIRIYRGIPSF